MPANGTDICKRYERLRQERQNFDARWEQMAPYIAPSRVGIQTAYSHGAKQTRNVYDSTSIMAAETFAMFMAGRIINPSDRWLLYRVRDRAAQTRDPVREWTEECRDIALNAIADSIFYAEAPEALLDYVGFGTGFLLAEERPQPEHRTVEGFRGFYWRTEKIGRYVIAEGADGLVDTAIREFEYSARNAATRWGEVRLPEKVRNTLKEGKPDTLFRFLHAIQPRPTAEQGAGALGMPWASVWVEKETKTVVHEGGYRTFPVAVPRYRVTPGEVYGRGPGELAFPDIWTLNMAKGMGLEDWALKIRPPILMRHDSVIGSLRLIPAGPTSVNTHGQPIRDVIMPFETGSRPEVSQLKEEELRRSIREIFFVDTIRQLLQVEKSEMTAFEFAQKLNLLFRMVATAYGRLKHEFLARIGELVFEQLFWAGAFPPPPPELFRTDGEVDVEFENPIARAQRAGDAEALALAFNDLAPMLQLYPQMGDYLDPDKTVAGVFDIRGVPAKWTRSTEEVAALRQAKQAQHEKELAMADATQMAEAAGKAAPMVKALQPQGTAGGLA